MQNSVNNGSIIVVGTAVITIIMLSANAMAFCGDAYDRRYPLTTLDNNANPFALNDTYGVDLGDGIQHVWCNSTSDYFCFDSANVNNYSCYLGDTQMPTFVDEGNGTDFSTPDDDLLLWWHGNTTDDHSKHNVAVANQGGNRVGNGHKGAAFNFDRADTDYLEFADSAVYNSMDANEAYSWCIWVNADSWNTGVQSDYIVGCEEATYPMIVRRGTNDAFITWVINTAGGDETVNTGILPSTGTWFHICGTLGGTSQKIFLNGDLKNTNTYDAGDMTDWNKIVIACRNAGDRCMDGKAEEFRLYNRTLTDDEIKSLHNTTAPDGFSTLGTLDADEEISILTPTNTTHTTEPIILSWSNKTDYDAVWYSLNNASNLTITGNASLTPSLGSNTVFLWMNDTNGTNYNDSVVFTFTPTVNVTITSPTNGSYQAPPNISIVWSYVSARECNYSWYLVDGENQTFMSCVNFTVDIDNLSAGLHNITIFANNTEGYEDNDTIWFNNQLAIVNCSAAGAVQALNFSFYTEDTLSALNGSAEFAINDIASDYTYNLSVVNVTNFTICILDAPRTVDMTMLYRSSGYEQRTYYFYHAVLTSTLQHIRLYNIDTTTGEKVLVNTRDSNDNDQSDVYVDIDRYYPETDSYNTIAIVRTDNIGEAITYLDLDDVFYRFTLNQAGVAVNTYSAMTITGTDDDPETLVLYVGAITTQFFDMVENVGISCYFNTTTNITLCSLTDPTGLILSATLYVDRAGLSSVTRVCEDSDSGASFTLTCNITNPSGYYNYYVLMTPSTGTSYTIFRDSFHVLPANTYGDYGILVAFFLTIGVAGMLSVVSPIIGVSVGLIIALLVIGGVINLAGTAVASVIGVGLFILLARRN